MSAGNRFAVALALVLAESALGCGGPSVREVCDNLDDASSCFDEWSYNDCLDDGGFLEDDARSGGCEDSFDDYLACVNVTLCTYDAECTAERAALESCVGAFP